MKEVVFFEGASMVWWSGATGELGHAFELNYPLSRLSHCSFLKEECSL